MILSIYDHEKSTSVEIPLTPQSTFVDVVKCCKGLEYENYFVTELLSDREEQIVDLNEKPYHVWRRNAGGRKCQLAIHKRGCDDVVDDSIFYRGPSRHHDNKRRIALSCLANVVSNHDRIIERQNKTVVAMEERLGRLRKEEIARKRKESHLLTLVQKAEVQERKVEQLRQQKGCGQWWPQLKKNQVPSLDELRIKFRATEKELTSLKKRVTWTLEKVEGHRVYNPIEAANEAKKLLSRLNTQNALNKKPSLGDKIGENKPIQKKESPSEVRSKVNDLRNRLNLNKRQSTASIQFTKVGDSSSILRPKGSASDGARPKSATEILIRSGHLSKLPPTSSLSGAACPPTSTVTSDPSTDSIRRHLASERDTPVTQHFGNSSAGLTKQPPPPPLSSSSSSLASTANPPPHKRRQRITTIIQINDEAANDDKSRDGSKNVVASSSCDRSTVSDKLPNSEASLDKLAPSAAKPYFQKVIRRTNVPTEHERPADGVLKKTSASLQFLTFATRKVETMSRDQVGPSRVEHPTFKVTGWIPPRGVDGRESKVPAVSPNENNRLEKEELAVAFKDGLNTLTVHQRGGGFKDDLGRTPSPPPPPPPLNISFFTPKLHPSKQLDETSSPRSDDLCTPASMTQVTPISTTMDNDLEGDGNIFDVTLSSSDVGADNDNLLSPSKSSANVDLRITSVTSNHESQEGSAVNSTNDSFFSASLPAPPELQSKDPANLDLPVAANETLSTLESEVSVNSYPDFLNEVLEQLDGSPSVLRHSVGGVRSLRKRLSSGSEDPHHHGESPRSSCTLPGDLSQPVHDQTAGRAPEVGSAVAPDDLPDFHFEPKAIPRRFFDDVSLETFQTDDQFAFNWDDGSPSGGRPVVADGVAPEESVDEEEVGDEPSKEVVGDVSFKDVYTDDKIIVISVNEADGGGRSHEKEPKIIVAGADNDLGEECSSGSSTSDSEYGDDDDSSNSFSPLIDTFCDDSWFDGENKKLISTSGAENNQSEDISRKETPLVESSVAVKGILKKSGSSRSNRSSRVVFNPLAILLDAALQGELDVVKEVIDKHGHTDMVNDEGITALHNSICAGHSDVARFLVLSGCDVNAPDSDLWTPLHCAASCYNLDLVRLLVENGACVYATTESEGEMAIEKCDDEDEDGGRCRDYLLGIQSAMRQPGTELRAAYDGRPQNPGELQFTEGDVLVVCSPKKQNVSTTSGCNDADDDIGEGWWLARNQRTGMEGYAPRNYLAISPRVTPE